MQLEHPDALTSRTGTPCGQPQLKTTFTPLPSKLVCTIESFFQVTQISFHGSKANSCIAQHTRTHAALWIRRSGGSLLGGNTYN